MFKVVKVAIRHGRFHLTHPSVRYHVDGLVGLRSLVSEASVYTTT